ncbi:MAG: hypothetical protein GWN30_22815, partial [Gammaproteobacteria bacterium]|nr:hypothetical protein [Gammaproteobacteria bacterium]
MITNSSGAGITLASGNLVRGLTVSNTNGSGVSGSSVNALTVQEVNVTNANVNGIHITNLSGTGTFDNLSVIGSNTRNVLIENNTGTSNITVTNSTFNTAGSEVGLDILGLGTANITFSVSGSSFYRNNSVQLKALAEDNSTINATITGNTFEGNPAVTGNSGVDLVAVDTGTLTFTVSNNTFQPFRSHAINMLASGGGTASGRVNNNGINGSSLGAGIRVLSEVTDFNGFNPSITIEVDGNTISGVQGGGLAGIHIEARDGTNGLTGTATIDATVTNNNVTTNNADAAIQIYLSDLNSTANRICLNATGNATEANGGVYGETDFFFGNDAITGSNSGIAQMQGFATSVSNTWFNVNGNTSTTSPTPLADGLGPISAGTCATVASLSPENDRSRLAAENEGSEEGLSFTEKAIRTVLAAQRDYSGNMNAVFAFASFEPAAIKAQANELADQMINSLRSAFTVRTAHASGETINLSLGDLDPGQVVAIFLDVDIDMSIPANVTQVCNQGLVTSDILADLLTDDPNTATFNDPTCTPLDLPGADLTVTKTNDTTGNGTVGVPFNWT